MKFLKNKNNKSTSNSSSSSGSGSGTTRPMDPDLKTRRIITATIPPTGTSANESSNTTADDSDFLDNDGHGHDRSPPLLGTLAQKTEVLQEKSEIWRKERLDATAKLRKEHKEKEIMEHRLSKGRTSSIGGDKENVHDILNSSGTTGAGTGNGAGTGAERATFDIPATFSVENKNPEHKRKSQSVDDETGKKLRSDSEVDREESNGGNSQDSERGAGAEAKTWRSKAAHMMKASGPGVLVAVAAIMAVRFLRK